MASSEAIPDLTGDEWLVEGTEAFRSPRRACASRSSSPTPGTRGPFRTRPRRSCAARRRQRDHRPGPLRERGRRRARPDVRAAARLSRRTRPGFLALVADQLGLAIRAARLFRSLEEKLRALAEEQRLRQLADDDRQRLLSMLVHDLKNPLSAVLASLELVLDRENGDPRLERLLRTSMASARVLAGMIDDALLVYRTGEAPATFGPRTVATVLALPFEEARWMAEARQIRIDIEIADPLPPVSLDAGRYQRAAANLLSNALKFSRRGGDVEVRVGVEDADGGRWLVLRVADSGPGVPESVKDRLSQPYQRFAGLGTGPRDGARAHGRRRGRPRPRRVHPRRAAAGGRGRLRLLALGPRVRELHAGRAPAARREERLGVRRAARHPRHRPRRRRHAPGRLLLVEQWREAVGANVLELPAGLAGDAGSPAREPLEEAARRELVEETGWNAEAMERLTPGPPSAGVTSEIVTLFRARGLSKEGPGGGVEGEAITVHEVPLASVEAFLHERAAGGTLVDPKVWAGLWFARRP